MLCHEVGDRINSLNRSSTIFLLQCAPVSDAGCALSDELTCFLRSRPGAPQELELYPG